MSKFSIGINCISYNSNETLAKALEPWIQLRAGKLKDLVKEVKISVVSACFPETYQLGYSCLSDDGTINTLESLKQSSLVDNLLVNQVPLDEVDCWNYNLNYLNSQKVDLIILLPADEIWNLDDVEKMLKFIQENDADWYNVSFKNYCINFNTYNKTFIVPRIWRTDRNGGVKAHYIDDRVFYDNGLKDVDVPNITIPFEYISPKHYSWVSNNKETLLRKLKFQNIRYRATGCSYRWNYDLDCLELNPDYYSLLNKPLPILYKDE